jgi:hypothetical protein
VVSTCFKDVSQKWDDEDAKLQLWGWVKTHQKPSGLVNIKIADKWIFIAQKWY